MPNSSLYQVTQIGLETTPGMSVAASKKLQSICFAPSLKTEVQQYRPCGSKYPTLTMLNKQWVEASIDAAATYDEIIYLLASCINKPTPTTLATGVYQWSFGSSADSADTTATYTVECGSSALVSKFTNAQVTGLSLDITRKDITVKGSLIGKAYSNPGALTTNPSTLPAVPVSAPQITFQVADTQAGLGSASLSKPLSYSFSIDNRFGAQWLLDGTNTFAATVETEPKITVSAVYEATAQTISDHLTRLNNGSTFYIRMTATGATISGANTYKIQLDTAVKMLEPKEFKDEDGVYAIGFEFLAVRDAAGWANSPFKIDVTNTTSSL